MTRKECLDKAAECVLQNRNIEYGEPEQSFGYISALWSAYLGTKLEPHDAAAMMALFKVARLKVNPKYEDGWADLAGYAACGAECAGAQKAREDAVHEAVEADRKAREQEFKCGDSLLLTMPNGEERHCVYVSRTFGESGLCLVRYDDGYSEDVPIEDLHHASETRAEGCEELVQKDAPQTAQELYQRILDCNPASYGHPHKPTGEELAELAQEDAHG